MTDLTDMIHAQTKGVYVIAATPFKEDGAIDFASASTMVEGYLKDGVQGMTILGMMGEANKLSPEESDAFMQHVLKTVAGRVPVVVGVSATGLIHLERLSKTSMDAGAAGVMVAPTPGLTTEAALYGYFKQVFAALGPDIPVCYQDFPQSTAVHISVETFLRLIEDFPSLVMFKHEDCPGLSKLSRLVAAMKDKTARRFSILCGNGGLYLPQEMARGADGAMTGFAFPHVLVKLVEAFEKGEPDKGEDLFDAWLPYIRHEQQIGWGLALRKETLKRRGLIACAKTRAPGPSLTATDQAELTRLLERVQRNEERLG